MGCFRDDLEIRIWSIRLSGDPSAKKADYGLIGLSVGLNGLSDDYLFNPMNFFLRIQRRGTFSNVEFVPQFYIHQNIIRLIRSIQSIWSIWWLICRYPQIIQINLFFAHPADGLIGFIWIAPLLIRNHGIIEIISRKIEDWIIFWK